MFYHISIRNFRTSFIVLTHQPKHFFSSLLCCRFLWRLTLMVRWWESRTHTHTRPLKPIWIKVVHTNTNVFRIFTFLYWIRVPIEIETNGTVSNRFCSKWLETTFTQNKSPGLVPKKNFVLIKNVFIRFRTLTVPLWNYRIVSAIVCGIYETEVAPFSMLNFRRKNEFC